MPHKIFVGNLSGNTKAEDIRALFEKYGDVTECDVLKNYGFVHMSDENEAKTAITELDGYSVKGNRMRVEMSTGKSSRGGGRGGGRGRGGRGGGGGKFGDRGDRYGGGSRYDPYSRRPPPYDDYYRGYGGRDRMSGRDDRRLPPPPEDRYRDRYYDRPPPIADPYDRYERGRPSLDPYRRPPPDYYNQRRYPDERGEPGRLPPPPPRAPGDLPPPPPGDYYNGYPDPAERAQPAQRVPPAPLQAVATPAAVAAPGADAATNYYDRFYKNPPARQAATASQSLGRGGMRGAFGGAPPNPQSQQYTSDEQSFFQTDPIFF